MSNMKKVCVLVGSTRKNGNTEVLTDEFISVIKDQGYECSKIMLSQKNITPCVSCLGCQRDYDAFGCVKNDDMQEIADAVLDSDIIILSTPIHSWYCTPVMKAVIDRMVFGMNKYYGEKENVSLWNGKKLALITSCGYKPEKGADVWEEGMKRYCKHSGLIYAGMLAERYLGFEKRSLDEDKKNRIRGFVMSLLEA